MSIFVALESDPDLGIREGWHYREPDHTPLIEANPNLFMRLDDIPGVKPKKRQSNGWGDGPVGEEWFPSSGDLAQQWRESN